MLTLPSALLSTFEELRLLTTVKITNDKLRMTNASSCHSERFGVRPWALGGEPSGAVSRTKENQVVQSG
ncbi:hypothetical protein [Tannerella forsythia]|uniref:hypothetical protein n=1 Tax=Tannerella forsythia TaxID=28112 RepID=UPI0028E7D1B3|nr:hypothetical protein [Tannerella forsythia]